VPARRRHWLISVALAALAGVAAAAIYLLVIRRVPQERSASLRDIREERLTSAAASEFDPSLSPDGTFFVYASDASGTWTSTTSGSAVRSPST